jgi:uncharacterized protein
VSRPYPRPLLKPLKTALADTPVVCVLGPRQCGKTTLVRQLEPRYRYLTFDDPATLAYARGDPTGFVATLPLHAILDEVQRAPELFSTLKLAIDLDRRPGRLVLTGSANILFLPGLSDSLAGRMEILNLFPLTAAEQAHGKGRFLERLLAGTAKFSLNRPALAAPVELANLIVTGGFPPALERGPERARRWHRAYLRTLIERDVLDVARIRDVGNVGRLLELLALRTASLLNLSSLSTDLGMRRETVEHYLSICERLFLIHRLPPWHRNPANRLIKAPKIHVLDSGLAATLSGLSASDFGARRERFGHLLESFVVQQLRAQASWLDPELRFWHYRDKDQIEVDLVITRGRDTWGIEVKSALSIVPGDGRGLRRLADQCGEDYRGGMLLYAGNAAFPFDDRGHIAMPLARLSE